MNFRILDAFADHRQDGDFERKFLRCDWVLARDPGFFLRPVDYYLPPRPTAAQASRRDAHGSMRVLALLKTEVTRRAVFLKSSALQPTCRRWDWTARRPPEVYFPSRTKG